MGKDNQEHIPTDDLREQVYNYAKDGMPHQLICYRLKQFKSVNTLKKHYAKELEFGKLEAEYKLGKLVYKRAVDGDNASSFFWLKTQAYERWTETQHIVTQDGGKFISDKPMTETEFESQYDTAEPDSVEAAAETENTD